MKKTSDLKYLIFHLQLLKRLAVYLCLIVLFQPYHVLATTLDDELLTAVKRGKYSQIEDLLKQGANVNAQDNNDETALLIAIRKSFPLGALKQLAEAGANLNVADSNGRTALHRLAVASYLYEQRNKESRQVRDYLDFAGFILKRGAKANASDSIGKTPIFDATSRMAKLLLTHGANPNIAVPKSVNGTRKGTTPLMEASQKGNYDLVSLLLSGGANPHMKDELGFHAACYARNILLKHGYPPYRDYSTKHLVQIEKLLLDHNVGNELPPITAPYDGLTIKKRIEHNNSLRCRIIEK